MLVEFDGNVYNADIQGDMVNIWKYIPVDGFKEKQTRKGTVYYESQIPKADVSEFFSVAFYVEKDNRKYLIDSLQNEKINIICDDVDFAILNGFKEIERGVWMKTVDKSFPDSFLMVKYIQNGDKKIATGLNEEELFSLWEEYVTNLSPSRPETPWNL